MSTLSDIFSPPFSYLLCDGRTITFRRMLSRQWAALIEELAVEYTAREDAIINKQVSEKDQEQRVRARYIARDYIKKWTELRAVARYVTNEISGIDRLLKFAFIGEDWESADDLIPPMDKLQIAENIVHLPIVKTANPSMPGGAPSATDTVGPSQKKKSRGRKSVEESNISSTPTQVT